MQYDSNGYARYKKGDLAVVVEEPGDFHAEYWNDSIEKIAGQLVHITSEESDGVGFYYSVKECSRVIDIAFLKPLNAFELSEDESEIESVGDVSCFIEGFKVVSAL